MAAAAAVTSTQVRESVSSNGSRDVADSYYTASCNAAAAAAAAANTTSTTFDHQFHHDPKLIPIPPIPPPQLSRLKIRRPRPQNRPPSPHAHMQRHTPAAIGRNREQRNTAVVYQRSTIRKFHVGVAGGA